MTCPRCGLPNPPDAVFCGRCGASLTASAPNGPLPSPPAPSVVLACVSGPDAGKRFILGASGVTLGTALHSGLLSDDPDAAPAHADFVFQNGYLYFRSHDGAPLFLDGAPLVEGTLPPGGQLRVGRSLWQGEPVAAPGPMNGVAPGAAARPVRAMPAGPPPIRTLPAGTWFQALNQRVGAVTGVSPVEGLDAREMFSSVLEKRTEEDVEDFFLVGGRSTTPPIESVPAIWPKPWLFFKIFLLSLLAYGGFFFGVQEFGNTNCLPGLILLGSFAIPLTVVVFYFEMNVPRNVSFYQVFRAILVGGVLALVVSLFGFGLFGAGLPGVIEEVGKTAALLLFVGHPKYRWTLNGLLLGGAVGAGFAGFESAGYALSALIGHLEVTDTGGIHVNFEAIQQTLLFRGVLAPGGHVAWAALEGAALWKVKGDQPFRWTMLGDSRFLRVLALAMGLHTLWDIQLVVHLPLILYFVLLATLIVVAWMAILSFIQDGIKQVQAAQVERSELRGPEQVGMEGRVTP